MVLALHMLVGPEFIADNVLERDTLGIVVAARDCCALPEESSEERNAC